MADNVDELYRAMGRVEGQLVSLADGIRDERGRNKEDFIRIMARLEVLETQLSEIIETSRSMQTQVYSNKHGIEGVNKDLLSLKMIYSRGLGAWAVIVGIGSFVAIGVVWALGHLAEVLAAVRVLVSGK